MKTLCVRGYLCGVALLVLGTLLGAVPRVSAGANYSAVIMGDSPLGYWRLGEDAGPWAFDSSGNGNHGTYNGGFILGEAGAIVGDPDTAAGFDGMTGFVSIPGGPFNVFDEITLEAWVINDGQKGLAGRIFSNGAPTKGGYSWGVTPGNARMTFSTYRVGGTSSYTSPWATVPQDDNYHYVAVTFDGATVNFYVDGMLADTVAMVGCDLSPFNLNIGQNPTGAEYWNGIIDEAAFYLGPPVLTPGQIMAHYLARF